MVQAAQGGYGGTTSYTPLTPEEQAALEAALAAEQAAYEQEAARAAAPPPAPEAAPIPVEQYPNPQAYATAIPDPALAAPEPSAAPAPAPAAAPPPAGDGNAEQAAYDAGQYAAGNQYSTNDAAPASAQAPTSGGPPALAWGEPPPGPGPLAAPPAAEAAPVADALGNFAEAALLGAPTLPPAARGMATGAGPFRPAPGNLVPPGGAPPGRPPMPNTGPPSFSTGPDNRRAADGSDPWLRAGDQRRALDPPAPDAAPLPAPPDLPIRPTDLPPGPGSSAIPANGGPPAYSTGPGLVDDRGDPVWRSLRATDPMRAEVVTGAGLAGDRPPSDPISAAGNEAVRSIPGVGPLLSVLMDGVPNNAMPRGVAPGPDDVGAAFRAGLEDGPFAGALPYWDALTDDTKNNVPGLSGDTFLPGGVGRQVVDALPIGGVGSRGSGRALGADAVEGASAVRDTGILQTLGGGIADLALRGARGGVPISDQAPPATAAPIGGTPAGDALRDQAAAVNVTAPPRVGGGVPVGVEPAPPGSPPSDVVQGTGWLDNPVFRGIDAGLDAIDRAVRGGGGGEAAPAAPPPAEAAPVGAAAPVPGGPGEPGGGGVDPRRVPGLGGGLGGVTGGPQLGLAGPMIYGDAFTTGVTQPLGVTDFSLANPQWYDPAVGHTGVDIGLERGTELRTPIGGTVTKVGDGGYVDDLGGTGLIEVLLDDGTTLRFGHMAGSAVVEGQRLAAGDVVGLSGQMGTGPHLHFEAIDPAGNLIDPVALSNANLAPGMLTNFGAAPGQRTLAGGLAAPQALGAATPQAPAANPAAAAPAAGQSVAAQTAAKLTDDPSLLPGMQASGELKVDRNGNIGLFDPATGEPVLEADGKPVVVGRLDADGNPVWVTPAGQATEVSDPAPGSAPPSAEAAPVSDATGTNTGDASGSTKSTGGDDWNSSESSSSSGQRRSGGSRGRSGSGRSSNGDDWSGGSGGSTSGNRSVFDEGWSPFKEGSPFYGMGQSAGGSASRRSRRRSGRRTPVSELRAGAPRFGASNPTVARVLAEFPQLAEYFEN